jgi:hypothetical protein
MEIELKGNDDDTEQTYIHLAEPFLLENKQNVDAFFCTALKYALFLISDC